MSINGTQRLNGSVSGASPLSGKLSVGGKGGNVDPATIESLIQQYLTAHPPKDGQDGKSAYEIALDNGFEGTEEEWLISLIGADGENGSNGQDGKSAYQYAQDGGYTGTEEEFAQKLAEEISSVQIVRWS